MAALEGAVLNGLNLNVPDVPQVENTLTNPSAELDLLGGWNIFSTTGTPVLTRVADNAGGSKYVFQVATTLTAGGAVLLYIGTLADAAPYTAGTDCFIRARAVVTAGASLSDLRVMLRCFDAAGGTIGEIHASVATTAPVGTPVVGTWYDLYGVIPAASIPGGTVRVATEVLASRSNAGALTIRADQLMTAPGVSVVVPYADGDTLGYEWSGTAHASKTVPAPRLFLRSAELIPAAVQDEWVESTDRDGALLMREPKSANAQWDLVVEARGTNRNNSQAALGRLTANLEEAAKNRLGIAFRHTPADSSDTLAWCVLRGQVTELPITVESGYFADTPVLAAKVSMACRPFGYGAADANVVDDFSVDTIASGAWAVDTGPGTISVAGGVLDPSSPAQKVLRRTGAEYYDAEVEWKTTSDATVTSYESFAVLKRLSVNDLLIAGWTSGGSAFGIYKVVGGASTQLAAVVSAFPASSSRWARFRQQGNDLILELFTSAPTATSTPATTVTFTLSGADATRFGLGVKGAAGLWLSPATAAWSWDDVVIRPSVYQQTAPMLVTPPLRAPRSGDVSSEGRVIVTDPANQSRDWIAWGAEWRNQNGSDLTLTQNELTNSGFIGTSTTRAGSVSTNIYRGALVPSPLAVCGTGNQPHVGIYRPVLRVYPTSTSVRVRLTYKVGDGPYKSLSWEAAVQANAWNEIELETISIEAAGLGSQRWVGLVEAYSTVSGDTVDVDLVNLIPAGEGFGRARRLATYETASALSARDEFDQTAGVLAAKTLPVGGTWTGAGDADDFAVEATGHTAERSAINDVAFTGRYAIAGTTVFTATAVQVDAKNSTVLAASLGAFARYTDTNNWFMAYFTTSTNIGSLGVFRVEIKVASVRTTLVDIPSPVPLVPGTFYTLRVVTDAVGRWWVWLKPRLSSPGTETLVAFGQHSALATGGALASGKVGIYDEYSASTATTRNYDNFAAWVPSLETVCYAGQSVEFRSDGAVRYDSAGTYTGTPPEYRGAEFFLPPAGAANRAARVAVLARRNDIATTFDANPQDPLRVQVLTTPRYRTLPHA